METHNYWGENGHNTVKYDNYNSNDGFGRAVGEQLNFAAPSEDEAEYPPGTFLKKGKVSRQDPMSHRIIEKRRRDRMNNCLADLSRLIPPEYLKKGRGRVEKTEIIEMAIRHIKFLQERANAAETVGAGSFRAGFQDAVQETARFLVDLHGFNAADSLCVQLAAHLQRHLEGIAKGEGSPPEGARLTGSSSETTSSSGSSHGLAMKGVIQTTIPAHQPTQYHDHYEPPDTYEMECDRVSMPVPIDGEVLPASEPLPLDGRKHNSPTLRSVRKPENDDYLHSYKFKNSIERRFSRSQDNIDAPDMRATNVKVYPHKRRRAARPALPPPCTSTSTSNSGSGSTEEARDTSPQDTSSESPHHHQYEKHPPPSDFVPVFALNALGKYYVPLNVEHACLSRLGSGVYDALGSRAVQLSAPLHPVTIHVNFQPCLDYHCVKRESNDNHLRQ